MALAHFSPSSAHLSSVFLCVLRVKPVAFSIDGKFFALFAGLLQHAEETSFTCWGNGLYGTETHKQCDATQRIKFELWGNEQ